MKNFSNCENDWLETFYLPGPEDLEDELLNIVDSIIVQ